MRLILQRVSRASVTVEGKIVGEINQGLLLLVGISIHDTEAVIGTLTDKCVNMRLFEDGQGKMNLSLRDIGGQILAISQFTLYADTTRGRRPNFLGAAKPELAKYLYDTFTAALREKDILVKEGVFGAMMNVELCNAGPVTIILDSEK